jgi:hypothetical protein
MRHPWAVGACTRTAAAVEPSIGPEAYATVLAPSLPPDVAAAAAVSQRPLAAPAFPEDPALIIINSHRRDLGDTGLAQPVIAGDTHDPALVPTDQRQTLSVAEPAERS